MGISNTRKQQEKIFLEKSQVFDNLTYRKFLIGNVFYYPITKSDRPTCDLDISADTKTIRIVWSMKFHCQIWTSAQFYL